MSDPGLQQIARDLESRRADFPQLARRIEDRPIIYLDSAATTLKPRAVIDAVSVHYAGGVAAVHRASHALGDEATAAYEHARSTIARFIGAGTRDIAFTRSATEAINLVSASLPADTPVASPITEHHSNLLPWRRLKWRAMPLDDLGRIELTTVERFLDLEKPRLIACASVSNAFGVRQPVRELIRLARARDILTLIDVSQSVGREPLDLRELDCDFACFSGHKMLGPSGVGVLYAHERSRRLLEPLLLGGGMVLEVTEQEFTQREFPHNLEAGSANAEGVIGLAAAATYLHQVGVVRIAKHIGTLDREFRAALAQIEGVSHRLPAGEIVWHRLPAGALPVPDPRSPIPDPPLQTGIVNFLLRDLGAMETARILSDSFGIMVRAGYHCAQPAHTALGLPQTLRASFHLYNTISEAHACAAALWEIAQSFTRAPNGTGA